MLEAQTAMFEEDAACLRAATDELYEATKQLSPLRVCTIFGGATDEAIHEKAERLFNYVEDIRLKLEDAQKRQTNARYALEAAQRAYHDLPSNEPSLWEALLGGLPNVEIPIAGKVAGPVFLAGVVQRRTEEREAAALDAYNALRNAMQEYSDRFPYLPPLTDIHNPGDGGLQHPEPVPVDGVDVGGAEGGGVHSSEAGSDVVGGVPDMWSVSSVLGSGSASLGQAERVARAIAAGREAGYVSAQLQVAAEDGRLRGTGAVGPAGVPSPVPPVSEWPFSVYRPGDVHRDGPLDGGYVTRLNPADTVAPKDIYLRGMLDGQRENLLGEFHRTGGAGAVGSLAGLLGLGAAGAGALTAARGGGLVSGSQVGPDAAARGIGGIGGFNTGSTGSTGAAGVSAAGSTAGAGGVGAGARVGGGVASGVSAGSGSSAAGSGAGSGVLGAGAPGAAAGDAERSRDRKRRRYGKSGVVFYDMPEPQPPHPGIGPGRVTGELLPPRVRDDEDDWW